MTGGRSAGIAQSMIKYLYYRARRLDRAVRLKVGEPVCYAPPSKIVINSIPTAGRGISTTIKEYK